jgi:hypothetical protein
VTHADDAKEVRVARQNLPCLQTFFCVAKKVAQKDWDNVIYCSEKCRHAPKKKG